MKFRHWLTALTRSSLIAAALATVATATSAQAQPAKLYSVQDFFKKPQQTAYRLSPDGKRIAFMQPYETRMNVFVQPTEKVGSQDDIRRVTSETVRDIAGFFFKSPTEVLYVKDFGGDENFHVVAADVCTGATRDLTPQEGTRATILDALEDDYLHILVTHNKRDKKVFDVYRINIKTGVETLAALNPGNFTGWITDHAGKIRGAVSADGVNTSLFYRETEADAFKFIVTTNFREGVAPIGWMADNALMYVSSNRGRDKSALFEFDPKTGKEGKLIFEHPEVDVSSLRWSRARKVMLYTNRSRYFSTRKPSESTNHCAPGSATPTSATPARPRTSSRLSLPPTATAHLTRAICTT